VVYNWGRVERVHILPIWLLVAGFFGAGPVDVIGTSATHNAFTDEVTRARAGEAFLPAHWK